MWESMPPFPPLPAELDDLELSLHMSTDSQDNDSTSDLGSVVSCPVPTPRGGFMARPGLKTPPRHAVVVRGGHAAISEEIPVARSSCPPPPPGLSTPSQPAPTASSEKITLPAIRTPKPPAIRALNDVPKLETMLPPPPDSAPSAWAPRGRAESSPPPSDAPVATSVPPLTQSVLPSRRRSGWAIVIAAAVGLLLGLVSIATTSGSRGAAHSVAAQPVAQELPVIALPSPPPSTEVAANSSAAAPPQASPPPSAAARPASLALPTRRKSIF